MLPSTETPLVNLLAFVVVIQVVAAAWLTVRQRRRGGTRRVETDAEGRVETDAEGVGRTSPDAEGVGRASPDAEGVGRASPDADATRREGDQCVVCPHCAAENDPEYTFCRNCVGELAAATTGDVAGDALVGRGSR